MAEIMFDTSNIHYRKDLEAIKKSIFWEKLKGKSIAVTGASGLLGSLIVDFLIYLNHEYCSKLRIIALGRNLERIKKRFDYDKDFASIEYRHYELSESFPEISVDYVVHCAGNSHPKLFAEDPVGTLMGNIIGTNNVLSYAARSGCRVLLLSSGEVYGENKLSNGAMAEDYSGRIDLSNFRACYSEGKRALEALCQSYIHQYGVNAVIARPCRIFGPTMSVEDNKASAQFLKRGLVGSDIILNSSGEQWFSYIYSVDAVSALLTILLKGTVGEAYNVANEQGHVRLKDFAECISKRAGVKVIYESKEEPGGSKVMNALLDSNKLQNLGWHPKYDLHAAIDQTFKIMEK